MKQYLASLAVLAIPCATLAEPHRVPQKPRDLRDVLVTPLPQGGPTASRQLSPEQRAELRRQLELFRPVQHDPSKEPRS